MLISLISFVMSSTVVASAPSAAPSESSSKPSKVTYRSTGKEVDFEELLIQGRLERPEISVVTGNQGEGTDGLLRLRENFLDRMAMDMAEEVK